MCRDQCPHHDNLSGRDDRAAVAAVESPMPTARGKELLVVELGSDLLSVAAAAAPPLLHHRSSLSYCCSSCSQCRSSPHHRHSTVLTVGRMVRRLGVRGVDRELGELEELVVAVGVATTGMPHYCCYTLAVFDSERNGRRVVMLMTAGVVVGAMEAWSSTLACQLSAASTVSVGADTVGTLGESSNDHQQQQQRRLCTMEAPAVFLDRHPSVHHPRNPSAGVELELPPLAVACWAVKLSTVAFVPPVPTVSSHLPPPLLPLPLHQSPTVAPRLRPLLPLLPLRRRVAWD